MAMHLFDPTMDMPRNISAGVTGVATGLLGGIVPVLGAVGGIVAQLLENDVPTLKRGQYITEGVLDGSVALLARAIVISALAAGAAIAISPLPLRAQAEEMSDSDAMVG